MFRFIVLCWVAEDATEAALAKNVVSSMRNDSDKWTVAVEWNGCAVLVAGACSGHNDAERLARNTGVVLGKAFRREAAGELRPRAATFGANETNELQRRGAPYLIECYWGRYIAIWRDAAGRTVNVLRDPSGTLPCFETVCNGLRVYFSWLPDCSKLPGAAFSVDWRFLTTLLPLAIVQARATALREVRQVLAGECVCVTGHDAKKQLLWDPHAIAQTDIVEDAGVAAELLRTTTRHCVWAWASCYDRILHRLSGGLDSSIVLSCLQDAPTSPRITALTHYSNGAHSDERVYARLAAQRASVDIVECEQPNDVCLEALLQMAPFPFPRSCIPAIQSDRLEARIAAEHGADAVFSGGGGDQIFYQGYLSLAAGDYAWRHGLRAGLIPVALSAARGQRTSMWFVLRDAIRDGLRYRGWHPMQDAGRYRQLLAPGIAEAARADRELAHPWFASPKRNPSGKTFHIFSLSCAADYYNLRGHADDAEYVHPLWSQPLLELALRIPTYVLTSGGWDRALARKAFAEDLPAAIVNRRTKAALDQHLKKILRKHLPFIRELLLDGYLVKQGLLDRMKLTDVLSGQPTALASPTVELFDYISTEAWVRSWKQTDRARAAA